MKKRHILFLFLTFLLVLSLLCSCNSKPAGTDGNDPGTGNNPGTGENPGGETTGYRITFDTNGGTAVPVQTVREGEKVTEPAEPTRAGYRFVGWYHNDARWNFALQTVGEDATLTAWWQPDSDTPYRVYYYLENTDGNGYALEELYEGNTTTDAFAYAPVKDYPGFTSPQEQSTVPVRGDGATEIKYYYKRNTYKVTFVTNGGDAIAEATLKYGAALPSAVRDGFTFGGWMNAATEGPSEPMTAMPAGDRTLYAWWTEEEMPCNFTYTVTGTGVCINGYLADAPVLRIPDFIDGMAVTEIGERVFASWSALRRVILPAHLTTIDKEAFRYCGDLLEVTLPAGLVTIGEKAFAECFRLDAVVLPDGIREIGDHAFDGCFGLISLVLPQSVERIGDGAFLGCVKLVEIENHTSLLLTAGGDDNGCVAKYAKNITENKNGSRLRTTAAGFVFYEDDALSLLVGYRGTAGILILPDRSPAGKDYAIADGAFQTRADIFSVLLPAGLTGIGTDAFVACVNLFEIRNLSSLSLTAGGDGYGYVAKYAKHITDGDGERFVTETADGFLFYEDGETSLLLGYRGADTAPVLPAKSPSGKNYDIGSYAFYTRWDLVSVTISDGVENIGSGAFYCCSLLRSVLFGNHVKTIGERAFFNCSSLSSLVFSDSVTSIGDNAFFCCLSLRHVTFGRGLLSIGPGAFYSCRLEYVLLPEGLEEIGYDAFLSNQVLSCVLIPESVIRIGNSAFNGAAADLILFYRGETIPNEWDSRFAPWDCDLITGWKGEPEDLPIFQPHD